MTLRCENTPLYKFYLELKIMKGILKPLEIFNIISKCLKEFDENLNNKNVMFIIEKKDRTIEKEEVSFPKSSYYHLTGVILEDKEGNIDTVYFDIEK